VLELIRGDEILWPPFDETELAEDDILLVRGSVSDITNAARSQGVEVIPELSPESVRIDSVNQTLAELVVSPGSRFEGASISEIGFRRHFGVAVIAVQRHGRHHIREKIGAMRLRPGDLLLVQGDAAAVERLKDEEGVILLESLDDAVRNRHRAPLAIAILVAVIGTATFAPIPVVACALAGAILMVLTGCLSTRQFYRSLDVSTLVLIAGMIGLGLTAETTGATTWAANHLIDLVRPLGPYGVLAAIYLMTNLLTEILSNAAAAVLMLPLAISTARELGLDDDGVRPFIIVVALAASAAFSTPIGYQTNTIVYGPGGYRFSDYARVGLPLNLLFWGIAVLLVPLIWPF
jgi:di/tricarboxylate transporter